MLHEIFGRRHEDIESWHENIAGTILGIVIVANGKNGKAKYWE
jgi:hypothetical protein